MAKDSGEVVGMRSRGWWTRFALGLLAGGFLILAAIYVYWPDEHLHIVTCDVGQGDAMVLTYGFQQVLIDAGVSEEKVLECLGEHLPWWDRTIELVVMTHADADHIGGMPGVLSRYTARTILFNGDSKDSMVFKDTMRAVQDQQRRGTRVNLPVLGLQWSFSLDQTTVFGKTVRNPHMLQLTVLSPRVEVSQATVENWLKTETLLWDKETLDQVLGAETTKSNDRSIVLLLEFGKVSALLTGDLEEEGELSLLAQGVIHPVTILKVGHHGSKTSSSWEFIKSLAPEVSLVSAGSSNRYGHPSPEVVERFDQFDIDLWRTDLHGTIDIETDGERYWITTEK